MHMRVNLGKIWLVGLNFNPSNSQKKESEREGKVLEALFPLLRFEKGKRDCTEDE